MLGLLPLLVNDIELFGSPALYFGSRTLDVCDNFHVLFKKLIVVSIGVLDDRLVFGGKRLFPSLFQRFESSGIKGNIRKLFGLNFGSSGFDAVDDFHIFFVEFVLLFFLLLPNLFVIIGLIVGVDMVGRMVSGDVGDHAPDASKYQ